MDAVTKIAIPPNASVADDSSAYGEKNELWPAP
jgi:hypothetical protein